MKHENYSIETLCEVAGKDLVDKVVESMGEHNCLTWFKSPIKSLGDKTPYELCKQGKCSEVYDLIGRLEHGVYS